MLLCVVNPFYARYILLYILYIALQFKTKKTLDFETSLKLGHIAQTNNECALVFEEKL